MVRESKNGWRYWATVIVLGALFFGAYVSMGGKP